MSVTQQQADTSKPLCNTAQDKSQFCPLTGYEVLNK